MKKITLRKYTIFALVLFLIFTLFPGSVYASKKAKPKVVRVGWYEDAYHITGKNGERSGYGYEYEQAVASYTGWKYEYVKAGWSELLEMLENGEIDMMGTLSYTKERSNDMLFSDLPMGTEKYYLYADLVHTNISASDLSTLNGKRVDLMRESVLSTEFYQWEKSHNLKLTPVFSESFEEGKENAVNRKIDCVVSTETTEWAKFDMSPIATIGSSDIYYCINKKRPDLKLELDDAMRRMENDKPFYADELYKKYLSSVASPVISSEEKKYLSKHGNILIGYLKNDTGFSAVTDKCEKPVGVINDYVSFAEDCLGKNALNFQLVGFDSQEEQLKALKEKKIDMIFHINQNPYEAEKNGIILSNTVINAPVAAVTTKDSFNENAANSVAIEKGNLSLKWHISYYYPEWSIVECDSTREAEEKVRKGQVDCFLTKSGQLEDYMGDRNFHNVFLTQSENTSFAVNLEDTTLLSILNKTLETTQSSMLTGALSMYENASKKVTITDFIKDNLLIVSTVFVSIFCVILIAILELLRKAKIAEEEAKTAKIQAENANAAKSNFLFHMSHDIRTPMNALLGYSQLIKKELVDPKLLDYEEKIEQSGNLLLSIINNVLDMARIESGKVELDENYSKIGDILEEVGEVFEVEANKKGISLTYEANVTQTHILCDITKVQKILMNLVSNAVKYTPSGGKVSIRVEELPCDEDGFVKIKTEVADTGIGIGKDYLPYLFDSFSRERNTTIGKVAGTGLGMSIVKKLVDMMDGSIEVESELGKGSKFTLILKHKIADEKYYEPKEKELSLEEKREVFGGKRILLAEDNDLNAEIATELLEDMGFLVDRVKDGIQCVSKIETTAAGTYDLILMDIQMPNMNGYQATQTIRSLSDKEKASILIIAMTANAFEEDKNMAFVKGMDEHIAKPIDIEKMEQILLSVFQ